MKKHLGISALLTGLLLTPALAAPRTWVGGNGTNLSWDTTSNWSDGIIPTQPNDAAGFLSGANLSVIVLVGSSATTLTTQTNTTLTLNLSAPVTPDTATLSLSSFLDIGVSTTPTNPTPSVVTVTGNGGVLHTNAIRVGVTDITNGNELYFTNGVIATSTLANSGSAIGRYGFNNLLQVESGAKVTVDNLSIGNEKGNGNNRLMITGANSEFIVGGTSTNRGLRVGIGTAGTSYSDAMQNNYVHVANGGKLLVTALKSGSTTYVNIGSQTRAHDNYILVEGTNSVFELSKGEATGSAVLRIGDADGLNYGGNYLEIRDGGRLISSDGHVGAISIYNHDNSDPAAQRSNRLTVGDNGTVNVGGAINVAGGLLQLSSEGSLTAASVTVSAGGRFEAQGDGFQTTGAGTTIQNLGTLAVIEETLSLSSAMTLANGATLELQLLDHQTAAGIELLTGGALTIGSTAKLRLLTDDPMALQYGATWQLFSGNTPNITGSFNIAQIELPTLTDGLLWDASAFNESGNWTFAVIPEPSTYALLGAGLALLAYYTFCRKSSTRRS